MIVWNAVSPSYFQGSTMRDGVAVGEHGEIVAAE
jgi:hypothetical protein